MSTSCSCGNSSSLSSSTTSQTVVSAVSDDPALCDAIVHETVCIQAAVTITPSVAVGEIQSFCVGDPIVGGCQGTPSPTNSCTFMVSQSICVQVPLTFSADAQAVPDGIVCGEPYSGACVF